MELPLYKHVGDTSCCMVKCYSLRQNWLKIIQSGKNWLEYSVVQNSPAPLNKLANTPVFELMQLKLNRFWGTVWLIKAPTAQALLSLHWYKLLWLILSFSDLVNRLILLSMWNRGTTTLRSDQKRSNHFYETRWNTKMKLEYSTAFINHNSSIFGSRKALLS